MYSTYALLCKRYGENNVIAWANLEGSTGKNAEMLFRVQLAIQDASNIIDAHLAHTYATPFADIPDTPALITLLCEKMTAIDLQVNGRGVVEENSMVILWRDEADTLLKELKTGKILLSVARHSSYPQNVKATT